MSLLVKAPREGQTIARVTPESAGWRYVGFAALRLAPARVLPCLKPTSASACIVVLAGTVSVRQRRRRPGAGSADATACSRMLAPYAVYLPPGVRAIGARAPRGGDRRGSAPGTRRVSAAPDRARSMRRIDARQGREYALRLRHPSADRAGRVAARGRGAHAGRAFVELSAAQARHRQRAASRARSRRLTTTGSIRRRDSSSSASTPTTRDSTRRWRSRIATW